MKRMLFIAAILFMANAVNAQTPKLKIEGTYPSIAVSVVQAGETSRINLTNENFVQDGQIKNDEALLPLFYTVKNGDNLFRIAQKFNRVSIDYIKEWNNLSRDVIIVGQDLVVGYLKIKKNQLGTFGSATPKQEEENTTKKDDILIQKEDIQKPNNAPIVEAESYFVTNFSKEKAQQNINGSAATFKTASGWNDKKFYVLMNDVTPGTVVKIIATNNKAVYAKVLGSLPTMKENNGLLLRVSSAAAAALDISDNKFTVSTNF
jgi:LysM repeat protein